MLPRLIAAAAVVAAAPPAFAETYGAPPPDIAIQLDALVAAYPEHLARIDGGDLVWKDGTRMAISDGREDKSFEELLASPDIDDMFAFTYNAGAAATPRVNADPGRVRNLAFFEKMYGDCGAGEVGSHLRSITWPHGGGQTVSVTTVNGVDRTLEAVARDLEALPPEMRRHLAPSAGTYNCRTIAGTDQRSMHAFAAAIDLNVDSADYWRWLRPDAAGHYTWRNRLPIEIVEVFERHGFIWGGRWYHYDTMHFEYRPELAGPLPAGD